jgi:PLP dependent protein
MSAIVAPFFAPRIMFSIAANLQHVKQEVTTAENRAVSIGTRAAKMPATLVAVSKTKAAGMVREAFAAGQRDFGENYVQEGVAKIAELADLRAQGIIWHFIGPLQSNKARLVAQHFDWVHGIDRAKIADALNVHRSAHDAVPLNVCVQVNVSGEASKSGVGPSDMMALAKYVASLPGLKLRGLMTIIENTPDPVAQRAQFRQMRELQHELANAGLATDTLSMGMSQDFAIAIEEGATLVRIGSAIFGVRS